MAAEGIICQLCGIEAPTRQMQFHQNVGALVVRFHRSVKGKFCKSCMHKKYWKMTGITLGVGWLGYISIIIAPCLIIANTVMYLKSLGMPAVPPNARVPVLDANTMTQLAPMRAEIFERLNRSEDLIAIANDLGPRVSITPGQVVKYVAALASQQKGPVRQPKVYGFPVIPVPQQASGAPTAAVVYPPPSPTGNPQPLAVNKPDDLPPPLIEI